MNFEPVLFEANKVTFEHGKPLDISCFNEVKTCHIMILMIGGRYGSIISEQDSEVEKYIYDKEYISITRKEYETALQNNIPTFIFIDKNVLGEYSTYKINRSFYEKAVADDSFKFFHVDSINIFKFIDLVSTKALKSFEKIEEIELYLRDQISGMFHLYLESLKQNSRQDEIFDAVKELKSLTNNMNAVIKEVGKEIIKPDRYSEIIDEQFRLLLSFFFDNFYEYVDFPLDHGHLHKVADDVMDLITDYFLNTILTQQTFDQLCYRYGKMTYGDYISNRDIQITLINLDLGRLLDGFSVDEKIEKLVQNYITKIKPLIISEQQATEFRIALTENIRSAQLPF